MNDHFPRAKPKIGKSRKYRPGTRIWSIQELVEWIYIEKGWVFYRDKPLHPGFIFGMPFNSVMRGVIAGNFRRANLNDPIPLPETTGADTGNIIQAVLVRGGVVCFFPEAAISWQLHCNWKPRENEKILSLAFRFEFGLLSHPDGGYSKVEMYDLPMAIDGGEL